MYGHLGLLHTGFERWEEWDIYLFSKLINFMDKIILEKSRIII
jgi:hypothetical protein